MPIKREKLLPKRPLQKPATAKSSSPRRNIVKSTPKRPVQPPGVIPTWLRVRGVSKPSSVAKSYGATPPSYHTPELVRKSSGIDRLAKGLLLIGFLFLVVYAGLRINQEIQLSYVTPKVTPIERKVEAEEKIYASPSQLVITKIGLDLPIQETAINNGVWEISAIGASYLSISARPGEQGTIIMYGHNTRDRFGPIRWLAVGEKIQLQTADGKKHMYAITKTMQVTPDRIDVLTREKGETLILYTCDGIADLKRFVIIAKPVRN